MTKDDFICLDEAVAKFTRVFAIAQEVMQVAGHQELVSQLGGTWFDVNIQLKELKDSAHDH